MARIQLAHIKIVSVIMGSVVESSHSVQRHTHATMITIPFFFSGGLFSDCEKITVSGFIFQTVFLIR